LPTVLSEVSVKLKTSTKLNKLRKLGRVELGLIGCILLVVAIMGYLVFTIQGPALRLTP
jgi:hypothetical protein